VSTTKATDIFIYSASPRFGFRTSVRVIFVESESSQSHKPFESESSQSLLKFFESSQSHDLVESSQSWVTRTVESFRVIGLQARVNVESHEISRSFYDIFLLWNGTQHAIKWRPIKLENGIQCCSNKFDCRLFISKFSQFAFYLSLLQPVISKSVAQPFCKFCSLSVNILLNVRFTTNGMCVMNNSRVARTSRNKISTTWDLYCSLVPQCEDLCTCYSAFPVTTKWCFNPHVKMVPGTTFTKQTCNRYGLLEIRGMLLQPLHWKCGWRCIESVVFACPMHENDQRWTCTRIYKRTGRHFTGGGGKNLPWK